MKKKKLTIVAAIAVALTATAVAVAQGESPPDTTKGSSARIDVSQSLSQFSVLRATPDTLPEQWRTGGLAGTVDVDTSRAVAIKPPAGEKRFGSWYAVPGAQGTCFVVEDMGSCATFEQLQTSGAVWFTTPGKNPEGVSIKDPQNQQAWEVRGIAPDGVSSVVAFGELPGGKGRGEKGIAKVEGNAFFLDLPHGADVVAFRDDRGKTVTNVSVGAWEATR